MELIEVKDRKTLREFISFPDRLYGGCPQYVPALHSDQVKSLTRVSSLDYCSRAMWLVRKDGETAGRICAMINPRYNERYGTRRVRFGWFDTVDDLAVAEMLINAAEKWALERGMDEIHGPLYYNTLGKQGMLVEGFDNVPPFNCIYNFPYYPRLVEALGFEKECDWLQYRVDIASGLAPKAERLAGLVIEKYGLKYGSLDTLKKDKTQVKKFFDMYNESFASLVYNFIPFTDREIDEEAAVSIPFTSDRLSTLLVDEAGEPAAFGIIFPSISRALQKARGSLFPFGWIHFLRAMRWNDTLDLMLSGATPKWQNKGVSSIFFVDCYRKALKFGARWAITNPQIETNSAVNLWSSYDSELYMRRRCYIRKIKK